MAMRDSRAHAGAGWTGVVAGRGTVARSGSPRSRRSPRSAPSAGTCGSATRSSRPRSRSSCPPSGATAPAPVLKISFPEPESEHEAAALAHWNGDGAARLLEADAERAALLIERLAPARPLARLPDEVVANTIAAGVLRRLWSTPPAPTRRSCASRRSSRPGPPTPRAGRRPSRARRPRRRPRPRAAAEPGEPVVLHQDPHGGNMLLDDAPRLARHRPQAAGRRARVRLRRAGARPPPGADARPRSARPHPPPPRPALRGARARPRVRGWAIVTPSLGARPAATGTPPWSPARAGSPGRSVTRPRQAVAVVVGPHREHDRLVLR